MGDDQRFLGLGDGKEEISGAVLVLKRLPAVWGQK